MQQGGGDGSGADDLLRPGRRLDAQLTRKVCLFASYDPQGRIRPHVVHYLKALKASGYHLKVAASGVAALDAGAAADLAGLDAQVCLRPNVGHDFGAWRDLIRGGRAEGADRVLLANDSVFGPLFPLPPIVERMDARAFDVWGMVESREQGWHLQSWFLDLSASALARPAVRRVFDQPFEAMTKPEIVARGELGLGAAFRAEGLACGAVAGDLSSGLGWWLLPVNPMHFSWRRMLREGVPFLKADLLRENSTFVGWANDWRGVVERRGYPAGWIDEALWAAHGVADAGDRPYVTPVRRLSATERLFQFVMSHDRRAALASALRPRPTV